MAGKSKNLPGHAWYVKELLKLPMGNFFLYKCRKCGFATMNGVPMPAPYDTKCERPE